MTIFSKLFSKRNKQSSQKLPEGWTETQISQDTYITHVTEEEKNMWTQNRREKDGLRTLINKDGFHDKPNGRTGTIYYVFRDKICEIEYEISGSKEFDICLYFDQLKDWIMPDNSALTQSEKSEIKEKLIVWLTENKIKAEF